MKRQSSGGYKREKGRQPDQLKTKTKWWRYWFAGAVFVTMGCLVFLAYHDPKSHKEISELLGVRVSEAFVEKYGTPKWLTFKSIDGVAAEGMLRNVIIPMREKLKTGYPILELRRSFSELIDDKQVYFEFYPKFSTSGGPIAISAKGRNNPGQPTIVLFLENFRERMIRAYNAYPPDQAEMCIEDLLLGVYLHEYFHIKKQGFYGGNVRNLEEMVDHESECWAYTCRDILQIMKQNNRGLLVPGSMDEGVYGVYSRLGGNTTDPEWRRMIHFLYIDLPKSSVKTN